MDSSYRKTGSELFAIAGITINGDKPWDIRVHNESFYKRVITEGSLGFGEAYMEGWWDAEKVDETVFKILQVGLDQKVKFKLSIKLKLLQARLFNLQSRSRAFIIAEEHYDLGNNLFQNMLDLRMNYSCGYWKNAITLNQAQENKLDLICRKLNLEPGMKVLDIGCGWGAFGKFAAEKYKVSVVGITVSGEQIELGRKLCAGLDVEFRWMDYRDLNERFDRIVSVGMIEHVGYKNYDIFFQTANKCLADGGLFLLHTIGSLKSVKSLDPWIHKYIFPNGMLPSLAQLSRSAEELFVIEDVHNFGKYYDDTLMAWYHNFIQSQNKFEKTYNSKFLRMWEYYLLSCAASFRARHNQLWQIVLSKNGVPNGYQSVR